MSTLTSPVNKFDHVQGNVKAPLQLVEYGDYECPHCGRANAVIKKIQEVMGDELVYVFRNFPLEEAHPHAMHAAIASEAADAQEKFWEMHDLLFLNQQHLDDDNLVVFARQIGLDIILFEQDFEKPDLQEKVEEDFESGVRSGVNGTPSFFINGEKYNGLWEGDELLQHLQNLTNR